MAEVMLPSAQQIRLLPYLARVAFAARCARRALPIYLKHGPAKRHAAAVVRAVDVAEQAATGSARVAVAVARTLDAFALRIDEAAAVARAIDAADAAAAAASAVRTAARNSRVAVAASAASSAAYAGVPAGMIFADFELLLRLTKDQIWWHYTPVPPAVFPPIDLAAPAPRAAEAPANAAPDAGRAPPRRPAVRKLSRGRLR